MFFKIQPIIFSLIFAGALEVSVYREDYFFRAGFFLVAFSVLAVWPLARKLRFLAIPFFLSLGSLSMLFLIDQFAEKQAFIVLSALVYYLALLGAYRLKFYDCDQTAQGMINLATISTIFFWYVSNYGWFLNFQIATWFLVVTFIGSTFLITLPSLRICAAMQLKMRQKAENKDAGDFDSAGFYSFMTGKRSKGFKIPTYMLINNWVIFFLNVTVSLLMAQIIWGLSLWPFGYLTTGITAVIIYYVFWDIVRNFIQGTLSKKAVIFNLILAILSVAGVLLTTRWELVI